MTLLRRCAVTAVLLCLTGAAGVYGADVPPRDLHQAPDGHWTAWDPPTEFPPGAQVHVIQPGDTLWALAGRFHGNPYLWPQIWERNQYIKDAHWIYPGDPLLISLEVAPVEELAEEDLGGEAAVEGEGDADARLDNTLAALQPLGSEDDIYCSGYIGEEEEQFGYRLIGSEFSGMSPQVRTGEVGLRHGIFGEQDAVKYNLTLGDIVYVDGGAAAGLAPGSLFSVVQPRGRIDHPVSGETIGRLYQYQGRLRLLTVNETVAIAEIVQVCDAIQVGAVLKPFVPEPVPLGRRAGLRPPNVPIPDAALSEQAVILRAKDDVFSMGEDSVVFVSLGSESGVAPGDVYTIYRRNRAGMPPVVLGELALLSVHARSSVARILESRYTVYVGDRLEPK